MSGCSDSNRPPNMRLVLNYAPTLYNFKIWLTVIPHCSMGFISNLNFAISTTQCASFILNLGLVVQN